MVRNKFPLPSFTIPLMVKCMVLTTLAKENSNFFCKSITACPFRDFRSRLRAICCPLWASTNFFWDCLKTVLNNPLISTVASTTPPPPPFQMMSVFCIADVWSRCSHSKNNFTFEKPCTKYTSHKPNQRIFRWEFNESSFSSALHSLYTVLIHFQNS